MKVRKPQSKRVPVRLRHKIEKASAAKQRKQRKEAKKNPQWRSRLKKDPGIPNLFPYKAKVLAELEEGKRMKEEEAQRRREVAKAQRQGQTVVEVDKDDVAQVASEGDEDGDVLLDEAEDVEQDDEMEVQDESNPMAALLASAQARVQSYDQDENESDENEEGDDDEKEWGGIVEDSNTNPAPGQATRKVLPKRALADPIKAVTALLDRMKETTDGIQRLMDHYQVPPLVTARSDETTSFLVEVARKRGRLGKGGVPNLHAAALTVLGDLNEERLVLPAVETDHWPKKKQSAAGNKGDVQVVSQFTKPFRIEGLWGEDSGQTGVMVEKEMVVG